MEGEGGQGTDRLEDGCVVVTLLPGHCIAAMENINRLVALSSVDFCCSIASQNTTNECVRVSAAARGATMAAAGGGGGKGK